MSQKSPSVHSSRPSTTSTTTSSKRQAQAAGPANHRPQVALTDLGKDPYGRRAIIHTGPDGMRPHNFRNQDGMFVGTGDRSTENTSGLSYLFRGAPGQKFPKAKNGHIGETGWERETWNI